MAWKPKPRGTVQVKTAKGWRAAQITNVDSATQLDLNTFPHGVTLNATKGSKTTKISGVSANQWRPA